MTKDIIAQHGHWHRVRWQIFWGLAAAALPPLVRLVLVGFEDAGQGLNASLNAFWGGLAAVFLGIFLLRNVGRYPGVEKASAIIPGFSVSFGTLVAILLLIRIDYSRWGLFGAYFCAIVIFYLAYDQIFGRKRLTIGIVPDDACVEKLRAIPGVNWLVLSGEEEGGAVNAVAADLRVDLPAEWDRRIADYALLGRPVFHSKHLVESLTGRVELEHLSETSFGTLSPPSAYMVPKHLVDRIVAALVLVLLAPLLAVVAVLVRLDTPGPAIFRQQRVGFRGEAFTVYKFRTMRIRPVEDADQRNDAITRENDSRITRLGRILRRSRIDELPQIYNILKGQMSWIGPRPEAAVLSNWYEAEIPFYRYRHIVRPGITGWAQVMQGHVADVEQVQSKLYYDFYYIKNFSLWIDILILVRTIGTMATGFGAK